MSPEPETSASQPPSEAKISATVAKPPATELTPEEQMARFEEELKEADWGHQPC